MNKLKYFFVLFISLSSTAFAADTIKVKIDNTWPDLKVAIDNTWPDCKIKFDNTWPDVIVEEENTWPDIKVKQDQTWPDIKVKQDQTWPDVVVGGTTNLILAAVACKQARRVNPPSPPSPPSPPPTWPSPKPPVPNYGWKYCGKSDGCSSKPFAYVTSLITQKSQKTFSLSCDPKRKIIYVGYMADNKSAKNLLKRDLYFQLSIDGSKGYEIRNISEKTSSSVKGFTLFKSSNSAASSMLAGLKKGSSVKVYFREDRTNKILDTESFSLSNSAKWITQLERECR
ncbi:MAG: hypothetical protein M9962_03335 [Oligoflexia bacterium]|nr:hypothetical protein [Oligoflexia bacterium]